MRACEGCRRRKIKCDAAPTSTWPCSACIRLKLHGVPPSIDQHQHSQDGPPPLLQQHSSHPDSPETYDQDQYGQQNLADLLGELKINEAGIGRHLEHVLEHLSLTVYSSLSELQNKSRTGTLLEEPSFGDLDEYKHALPASLSGPDLKVRIPPELMPEDETSLHYFDMYFMNVHPYVPVINKALFYQQWHTNREAISPLILEAIFAIAGRLADEPAQGQKWLALASSEFISGSI
jgi:hypothetical protein